MLQRKQTIAATAKPCGAMESGNHSKNGASLKSLMSKGNLWMAVCVFLFSVMFGACKDEGEHDDTLPVPTGLVAEVIGDSIKVSWNPVKGADEYQITYWFESGWGSDEKVLEDNHFILYPQKEGTYSFEVRAYQYGLGYSFSTNTVTCVYSFGEDYMAVPIVIVKQDRDTIRVTCNPVKGADKYSLRAYADNSLMGTYDYNCSARFFNLRNNVKYSFQVKAFHGNESTEWSDLVSCVYVRPGGGTKSGLYMGIIGFNEELKEKEIGLLTDYQKTYNTKNFTSFVNGLSMKSATSFYYAVDNAINRLENAILPEDLESVSIVTFTDGLDNASIDLNTAYNSRDAYRDAVKKRIADTKVKNLPINAYSIGVRGSDVNDVEAFRAGLIAMASKGENAKEVTNMTEVYNTFSEIAASLYNENQSKAVKLKITGGYDDGTKIRFTWDDVTDAADSKYYIEGVYKRNGTTRTLENVVYHGISSSSGKTITGEVSGVYVTFTFKDVIELISSTKKIQQWEYISSTAQWQRNSEFGQTGDIETVVDKKSAVIMLVLDCTTSLGSTDFKLMKDAAVNFIEVLTNQN